MKRKLALLFALVFLVMAFTPVAFARWEACSYCGSRLTKTSESDPYGFERYYVQCRKYPNRQDIKRTWKTDCLYECPNPACGMDYVEYTETHSQIICNHK